MRSTETRFALVEPVMSQVGLYLSWIGLFFLVNILGWKIQT